MSNDHAVIEDVEDGSPAHAAGIEPGDEIIAINGVRISDIVDYMFAKDGPVLNVSYIRKGRQYEAELNVPEGEAPGISLAHFRIKRCRNKCMFCFVSQLPKGLRKTLYVKDEDYRMSFLYGNYITLSNITAQDKKRIITQRLSPLYISVHTTDNELRAKMLGVRKSPDIMKELRYFTDKKIRIHAQIVLCPGYNDGRELKKTIGDLYTLYPYLQSIAVVPVGLTNYGNKDILPVGKKEALEAIATIEAFQRRFAKKHGDRLVYAADELYIKAMLPIPPAKDYGDLPQIENGVGMTALFQSQARRLKIPDCQKPMPPVLAFTGVSFFPYLSRFISRLQKSGYPIELRQVKNTFFGSAVTVTGLLTGRDIIMSLQVDAGGFKHLIIPDSALSHNSVFLDDVTLNDIERALALNAVVVEASPAGLLDGLQKISNER